MRKNFNGGKSRDFRHGEQALSKHNHQQRHGYGDEDYYFKMALKARSSKKADVKRAVALELQSEEDELQFWAFSVDEKIFGKYSERVEEGFAVTIGYSYKEFLKFLIEYYGEAFVTLTKVENPDKDFFETMTSYTEVDLSERNALWEGVYSLDVTDPEAREESYPSGRQPRK